MKTKKQWDESKLDFSRFINNGDEIDDSIYWYFLEVLPPRKMTHFGFLCGEPYTHNSKGEAMYDTFYESPSKKYYYGGLKTVKDFIDPNSPKFCL